MPQLNKEQEFALEIGEQISGLFDKDNENYRYDLEKIDLTKFFTGIIIAGSMFYQNVTDEKGDLMDYQNINNRLIVQYLLENGKERGE